MRPAEHVRLNRAIWDQWASDYFGPGLRAWARDEPNWGIWNISEGELGVLPSVAGRDVLELGCGTAYWSAWLARRGARVVGLDNSLQQLRSARHFQQEFGLAFPLVQADAEAAPFGPASFDMILSEYGASIWCDPYRWIPEAARLLRPGGELIFLRNSTLLMLCTPPDGSCAREQLARDYFGMHRFEWPDDHSVEFHLSLGDWIRLLRRSGFAIEDLVEIQAPADGSQGRWDHVTVEWSRRWPSEEIWRVRKEG
jgi:SAM-dependent methyltransferase